MARTVSKKEKEYPNPIVYTIESALEGLEWPVVRGCVSAISGEGRALPRSPSPFRCHTESKEQHLVGCCRLSDQGEIC